MTYQRLFAALFIAAISITSVADDIRIASKPGSVGLSEERLARIDRNMQALVDSGMMIGAMGMIVRNGEVAYTDTWGLADREANRAMTEDAIFRIYSMSKPITSVAIMTLYEQGAFELNDPIAKYMPEFAEMKVVVEKVKQDPRQGAWTEDDSDSIEINPDHYELVDAERPITVRDLLCHTSGLTYGIFGNSIADKFYRKAGILRDQATLEEFTKELGKLPLINQPGTKWHYSVSTDVLGRLVEVLSGMPYDQYLQTAIFDPLDMRDTGFHVPEDKMDRFVQMYTGNQETRQFDITDPELSRNFKPGATFFGGGGGLVSTARDYARFGQMMLNGGNLDGAQILSPKTIELMTIDHVATRGLGHDGGYGFGLGFAVAKDQALMATPGSLGEYNWGGAAGTKFWIDPQEQMVGVFMVQKLPPPMDYGTKFKNLAYMAIVE